MRLIIYLFITAISYFPLQAQEREILKGKITNDSLLSQVHVVNITTEKGTLSEDSGEFSLRVSPGDSILFSSVQYKKLTLEVTPRMLEEVFEIKLENELTELDEVQLHELSGNLQQDIENIETVNQADFGIPYSNKKPPTIVDRKIRGMSSPMDPAGAIYGAISGEKRKLKQALKNDRLKNRVIKARNLLSEDFYREELNLEEERIIDFLYYCAENPRFLSLAKEEDLLGLIEFYKKTLSEYREYISLD